MIRLTNLGCTIEATDEIRCDFVFGGIRGGAQVADLELVSAFIDLEITSILVSWLIEISD